MAVLEPWEAIAARKKQERDSKIPPQWRIPSSLLPSLDVLDVHDFPKTDRELLITESTASTVVSKIASGEWTALEVTEARDGKTIGPLHGLLISLKVRLGSTIGYVSYAEKPATSDSTLVTVLVQAGAILYVKTNVPATLMMGESVNNVFGRTKNPRNRELTSSGSSSGESCLVSFRESFMGIGTDIGGSIRNPSSFTELTAIQPSHSQVSYQNAVNTYLGQEVMRSCAGPMCRSVSDVRLFMSAVASQSPWLLDPQTLPIPWRSDAEKLPEKLCFGFGMGDGTVMPTPPLMRAMEIAKAKLIAAGHSFIDFIPSEHIEAADIISKMWEADSGEEFQRDTDVSVFDTWQNRHKRALLAQRWLEKWQATASETGTGRPIDGLIMPSIPFPAARHDAGYPHHWGALSPLLDLTTGVFPVTQVDLKKDVIPSDWEPISETDGKVWKCYGKPKNHENALVGLTVIGRILEEEKVTAMLDVITKALGIDY
ncbi:amidase [Mytilinidion resinicola]|uniref:Amidase n=1 Tax=Mytilinidion resinicola TaxID=574789 RepID=A0A6A6Z9T3_9PEZI|nr:amidase [Mytilinidion resinicola]KAF2817493.1 amidase [Mytilinidion resinicola]